MTSPHTPTSPPSSARMITGIYMGVAGALLAGSLAAALYALIKNPELSPWLNAGATGDFFQSVSRIIAATSLAGYVINIILCAMAIGGALALRRGRDAGRKILLLVSYGWGAGVIIYGSLWIVGWFAICFSGESSAAGSDPAALRILAWLGGAIISAIFVFLLLGPLIFFIRALRQQNMV